MFLIHKQDNMKTNVPGALKGFILQSREQLGENSAGRNSLFGKKMKAGTCLRTFYQKLKKNINNEKKGILAWIVTLVYWSKNSYKK